MPIQSGQRVTYLEFNSNIVEYYNTYWSGGVYTYTPADHITDPDLRNGWGQDSVYIKHPTDTVATSAMLIEAEHLNTVIAQIHAGLYHIDPDNFNNVNIPQKAITDIVTASDVLAVKTEIQNNIEALKYNLTLTTGSVNQTQVYAAEDSSYTTNWDNDLQVVHKFTWTTNSNDSAYNQARHFFNSGGKLTLDLESVLSGTDQAINNDPFAGDLTGSGYVENWDQLFDDIGVIRIGAESTNNDGPTNVPVTGGFYSTQDVYTQIWNTAGTAHGLSDYNQRAVTVEAKLEEDGNDFHVYVRVTLLEDDVADTRTQLADITLESGYIVADTCPTNHTTLEQSLMTPAPPGSYTFAFISRQEPTVTEDSPWTDVSI